MSHILLICSYQLQFAVALHEMEHGSSTSKLVLDTPWALTILICFYCAIRKEITSYILTGSFKKILWNSNLWNLIEILSIFAVLSTTFGMFISSKGILDQHW